MKYGARVIPFRRPEKPRRAAPEREPERCPRCGWRAPAEFRAERGSVRDQLLLYYDCPECGAGLVLLVQFDP